MKKILLTICIILLPGTVLGFTENPSAPTQNNTPTPINTSGTTQVKTGALVSNSYIRQMSSTQMSSTIGITPDTTFYLAVQTGSITL